MHLAQVYRFLSSSARFIAIIRLHFLVLKDVLVVHLKFVFNLFSVDVLFNEIKF